MTESIKELLSDRGRVSSIRCMSLLCCITAVVVALIGIAKATPDYAGLSMLCGTFLSIAFAGKVSQKAVETKISPEAGRDQKP